MVTKMSAVNDKYTYRVIWSEEYQEYVGLCAEFPSLSWLADEPEKALKGVREGNDPDSDSAGEIQRQVPGACSAGGAPPAGYRGC
jgi:hypothetical protein